MNEELLENVYRENLEERVVPSYSLLINSFVSNFCTSSFVISGMHLLSKEYP